MKLTRYFFEALRTRMENILRALSGNRQAYIIYGNTIATDVQNQVVLEPRDYIVPGVKCSLVQLYLFYKACTAHEGGHIRFTSRKAWDEACRRGPAFQHLTNIIEDGRIEAAVGRELPGAGRWLKFINQYIFKHRKDYGTGIEEFLGGVCSYSVYNRIPNLSPEATRLVKLAAPYVDIGKAAPNTEEVLKVVEEILNIPDIKKIFESIPPPPIREDKGTDSPQEINPSQEIKERAKKAQIVISKRQDKGNDEAAQPDNSKESLEKSKKSSQDKKKPEEQTNGQESDENTAESTKETPGNSNKSSDSGNSFPEENFDGSDEPFEENNYSEKNDPGEWKGPKESSGQSEKSEEFSQETSGKESAAKANTMEESSEEDFEEEFFQYKPEEDFTELIISSEEEIQGVSQEAREMEEAGKTTTINTGYMHRHVELVKQTPKACLRRYTHLKKNNERIIKQLIEEIRVALETKKSYYIRGLNRGKLNTGSIYRLAIPDPNVFAKKRVPGDIPELALCIMVDLSGSMHNGQIVKGKYISRIDKAKDAACVITETCRELKITHKIIGYNAYDYHVYHYNIVDWEDTESSRISSIDSNLYNRDGYSIRMGAQELLNRPEERKLLIVLSDGIPQVDGTYPHREAVKDTREAAQEIKKMGIEVISLFFGDSDDIQNFKYMYSNPVFVDEIDLLPIRLGEVFKRVLLN